VHLISVEISVSFSKQLYNVWENDSKAQFVLALNGAQFGCFSFSVMIRIDDTTAKGI